MKPWHRFDVGAYGNAATGYLLVGEAPGHVSWKKRRRLTGPAGMLIRRALQQIGHPRYKDLEDLFYMTDVVKCHPAPPANPTSNRAPTRAEVEACADFLAREVKVLQPSVIIAFGKAAAEGVTRSMGGPGKREGQPPRIIVFPHPSPRNRRTILKTYSSMQAFEEAIAATFRDLIAGLEPTRDVKREA